MSSTSRRSAPPGAGNRVRGASMVEYMILLVAMLLVIAGAYKLLGNPLGKRSAEAGDTFQR